MVNAFYGSAIYGTSKYGIAIITLKSFTTYAKLTISTPVYIKQLEDNEVYI